MRGLAPAGVVVAVLLLAAPASADTPVGQLPTASQAELDASVHVLELNVHQGDLDASVTQIAQESTDGGDEVITLASDILFAFDKSDLSSAATARIEDLVAEVPKGAAVDIGGYTDSLGSTAYNKKLSTARAKAVADVVGDARSDLDLTVKGFGEADPVAPNTSGGDDDPVGRAKNRRVEIRYSP